MLPLLTCSKCSMTSVRMTCWWLWEILLREWEVECRVRRMYGMVCEVVMGLVRWMRMVKPCCHGVLWMALWWWIQRLRRKHACTSIRAWQHPRSKRWQCIIDYIMMRRSQRSWCCDVSMLRSADCWTDHKLLRACTAEGEAFCKESQSCRKEEVYMLSVPCGMEYSMQQCQCESVWIGGRWLE